MEFMLSFGLLKFGTSMRQSSGEFKIKIVVEHASKGQRKKLEYEIKLGSCSILISTMGINDKKEKKNVNKRRPVKYETFSSVPL